MENNKVKFTESDEFRFKNRLPDYKSGSVPSGNTIAAQPHRIFRSSRGGKSIDMDIIRTRLAYNLDNRRYCYLERKVDNKQIDNKFGYVVDISNDYVLLQETDDFEVCGYLIIPINTISKVRFNNNDKYYDKIMHWEKLTDKIEKKHEINLSNWESIFKSIKSLRLNVIIENETPDDCTFDIGPITKVSKEAVFIRYFNAKGLLDLETTKIVWSKITIVKFDDKYINIFSKYLRERKGKTKNK